MMIPKIRLLQALCPCIYSCGALGIFGIDLGLGAEKSSSDFSETTDQTVDKKETTKTASTATTKADTLSLTDKQATDVGSQTTSALSSQLTEISSLDEETQKLLQDLLAGLGESGSADLIASLQNRALSADADLAGITDPIIASAEAKGEERVGQTVQALSRSAGSSQNSLVQQLGLEEGVKVDREIADLAATLGLQTREIATQELQGAVGAGEDLAVQLANVLKGASQTQTGTVQESSQTDTLQQLSELISASQSQTQVTQAQETTTLQSLIDSLTKSSGSGSGSAQSASLGGSFSNVGL